MARKVIEPRVNETQEVTALHKHIENKLSELASIDTKPVLKENEILLPTLGVVTLKPTKLKYFKQNVYSQFMLIKNMGVMELLKYEDGEDVILSFIGAVLDMPKSEITFLDDIDVKTLMELIEKINKINEISDEDFLEKLEKQVVV